jgi:SAM-dependent methyltransferase
MGGLPVYQRIALALERAQAIERDAPQPRPGVPWLAFNLLDFTGLLIATFPFIGEGGRFLDVGCGPGSKMLLARDGFGLDVYGFDINPAYVAAARDHGLPAELASAEAYDGYKAADCVWLNRPRRDREGEAILERQIWDEMAPGAVIICANLEHRPPENWFIIEDQWQDLRRGAWLKPYEVTITGEPAGA